MCGIAGVISADVRADELRARARDMASTLCHRGPDDEGVWIDEDQGVAFGHRRLSVIDLSEHGHQPMASRSGRHVITFNGEIYNYLAIRRDLEGKGVQFHGDSDTEVLLEAIERWGLMEALSRANGMFALAVWDRRERQLFLARDRIGEKPLYYTTAGTSFMFSSTMRALHAAPGFRSVIDRGSLSLFMRHSYVPSPYSIFEGVAKLAPGTVLRIDPQAPHAGSRPVAYWSAKEAAEAGQAARWKPTPEEAADALEALLRDSARLRMVADVPLGAFLSGGIDSATVVAMMQAESSRPVRTFTVGFGESRYDESARARAVAAHLGTEHTELRVSASEAQAVIPRIPDIWDEPFADSSQIPTFLVSQLARRSVTVALSGDGGDELFGGYERYLLFERLWRRLDPVPGPVRTLAGSVIRAIPPSSWDRLATSRAPLIPAGLRRPGTGAKAHRFAAALQHGAPEGAYRQLVSLCDDPASLVPGGAEPPTALTDPTRWAALDSPVARMMHLDIVSYLPDDILTKVDRASMAVGLEARVPILDHRIVEFAHALPMELKVRDGVGKQVLRDVLRRYVPPELTEGPKMGFGVPIGAWLRGPLQGWASELLEPDRLRDEGYLSPGPVAAMWEDHLAGRADWEYQVWNVLMFESWLDVARSSVPAGCS
jgi:asparagine synthase (glutamine-hydrolysing)